MNLRNTVQREDSAKPIGFSPQQRSLQDVDSVTFFNEDHHTSHQPYPTGGDKDAWGGVITPQGTSNTLVLNAPGIYPYACFIHPDETGSITVANQIQIGASPQGGVAFGPNLLVIPPGQSVSWLNSAADAHQPAPVGGPADAWTAPIEPESPASTPFTFANVGSFPYECALHPDEKATILVSNVTINSGTTAGVPPASFSPTPLSLTTPNNQVVWDNADTINHEPTPDTGAAWLSGPIAPNAVSDVVTLAAGTYPYHCALHPTETGTITVTE